MGNENISSLLLRIRVQFHDYKGWRIVNVEDENGIKREHLLLPMLENGIEFVERGPKQNLMLLKSYSPNLDRAAIGCLFPYISKKNALKMIELGMMRESDMNKMRFPTNVGYAFKPYYFSKNKKDE